ncbi:MAG TPA: recombination mediator RecR [Bacillota bacterium]|nr:recombination mediator RecR [Bacillota bacterium]
MLLPPGITRLIRELTRLPGVGPRTAQRMAFFLLARPPAETRSLADALVQARERTSECSVCCGLTEEDPCALCSDPRRDPGSICVVEQPADTVAVERTREFNGRYHVLHGAISPLDGVGPEDIRLAQLTRRVEEGGCREVIVATNPSVEGETTAMYIARLLKPYGVRVTRPASGLPAGGDLEYADQVTLSRALHGRQEL